MSIKLRLDAGNDKYIILRNFSGCIVSGLEVIDKGLRGLPRSREEKRAWFEWITPLHEIMKRRLPQLRYACNHSYCCGLYLIISSYLSTLPFTLFISNNIDGTKKAPSGKSLT